MLLDFLLKQMLAYIANNLLVSNWLQHLSLKFNFLSFFIMYMICHENSANKKHKNSAECYVAPDLCLYIKNSMKALVWPILAKSIR